MICAGAILYLTLKFILLRCLLPLASLSLVDFF